MSDLDSNGDGVINKEELYTLEDLGIQQLNLDYTSKEPDDNGNDNLGYYYGTSGQDRVTAKFSLWEMEMRPYEKIML